MEYASIDERSRKSWSRSKVRGIAERGEGCACNGVKSWENRVESRPATCPGESWKTLTRSIHFVSVKDGGGTRDTRRGWSSPFLKRSQPKGPCGTYDRVGNLSGCTLPVSIDSVIHTRLVRCLPAMARRVSRVAREEWDRERAIERADDAGRGDHSLFEKHTTTSSFSVEALLHNEGEVAANRGREQKVYRWPGLVGGTRVCTCASELGFLPLDR